MKRIVLGALSLGFLLLAAGTARADVESTQVQNGDVTYKFLDDLLNSNVSFPQGANIRVRPGAARTTLIRPRASFVPEMLKSVEKM
jgi:hypothetical protein